MKAADFIFLAIAIILLAAAYFLDPSMSDIGWKDLWLAL